MTPRLVRTRLALGPFVPTLRRLTRAPSIKRKSVSARSSGCDRRRPRRNSPGVTLPHLEFLNNPKAGMPLLRQFDGGVGEIAAALVLGDEYCGLVHETVKLSGWVPGICGLDFGPDFVRLSPFVIQILDNKLVLRIEMAIKRHLAGAGRLGDGFDANASDATSVKKVCAQSKMRSRGFPALETGTSGSEVDFSLFMVLDEPVTDRYQRAIPTGTIPRL